MTENKKKRWHYHDLDRRYWIDSIRKVVPHIPMWFLAMSRFIGAVICFFYLGHERRAIMKNLEKITHKHWISRASMTITLMHNFAKQFVSFAMHNKFTDEYWQQQVIKDDSIHQKIDGALARGKGLILISAHLGNWEMGKHLLSMGNTNVTMVMIPSEDSQIEEYWNQFRNRKGLNIIDLKESPFASLEILRALKNNEIVLVHGDRIFNKSSVKVPFFGEMAYFPLGPMELVRITEAPIMSVFFLLDKKEKYRVILDDSMDLEWTGNRKPDVELNISKMAKVYEKYITLYPTQWYIFYDFWALPPALDN